MVLENYCATVWRKAEDLELKVMSRLDNMAGLDREYHQYPLQGCPRNHCHRLRKLGSHSVRTGRGTQRRTDVY